jgi:hypothetical protein
MRGILILVTIGGALAVSGVPIPEPGWVDVLYASRLLTESLMAPAAPAAPTAGGAEAISLLLLGGGFFAASIFVRRRG